MPDTLCWSCRNAVGNCSWSQTGTMGGVHRIPRPVPGWKAKKTKIKNYLRKTEVEQSGYIVFECPLYVADKEESE